MYATVEMRRGRWAFGLTLAAFAWAAALVVGALVLPVYSVEESGDVSSSATLVAVNGLGVLLPVAVPALITAVVWIALHRRCSRGSRFAGALAWTLAGVLVLSSMLAIFSIGLVVLPVALLLLGAAALTPSPA